MTNMEPTVEGGEDRDYAGRCVRRADRTYTFDKAPQAFENLKTGVNTQGLLNL